MEHKKISSLNNSVYLNRSAWKQELFPNYRPPEDLNVVVVLPAFNEPEIEIALHSLNQCLEPVKEILIIIVVNEPKGSDEKITNTNLNCLNTIRSFGMKYQVLTAHLKLPEKKAGVGLARKIGMDEAVRLFRKIDHDGVIVCYDANCRCEENYLIEIEKEFENDSIKAAVVFYEHSLNRENHESIINYELSLRYYTDALRYTGFPYAHQTLGSCIAVRCSHYERVGGMSTRNTGEDFYFLNKTIPLGGFTEINSTTIRPSDRASDRVPFGTEKAVHDTLRKEEYSVYHPNTFEDLKLFFLNLNSFRKEEDWKIPMSVGSFLGHEWRDELYFLKEKVASEEVFKKQFFHWFDAFKVLEFVHFARDNFYHNVELEEALEWLRRYTQHLPGTLASQLIQLRYYDRNFRSNQTGS